MNDPQLTSLLQELISLHRETEWVEFKANRYDPQTLGEYLSALSNSACLHWKRKGYLVFGIEDKTHIVKGTSFDPAKAKGKGNQDLQMWLATGLHPNVGFNVHRLPYRGNRVVLFEVNAAIDRPVFFYGTAWIRIGSSKTKLINHPAKEREIWSRRNRVDWSAQICERVTIEDLDTEAILKARQEYKTKFPQKTGEVDKWDDIQFLNKSKLTIHGRITNAAIVLLGKPESATLLSPAVARISWLLKDEQNREKDYEHFDPPFLLNVDRVFSKVRNLRYRHMPSGTLFPMEITQYDHWVIREALHNCIAHQDYDLHGRINLVETPSKLILTNMGSFLPGSVETVIRQDAPPEVYRNPFLATAMVNLNMIDTQGGGIKKMFQTQMNRYFPLPDYDLSQPDRVVVKIRGEVLDERYTRLLMERTDLDLWTVILLDKVQRGYRISREEHKKLKRLKLVEGRYPNLFISSRLASETGEEARHIRYKGFDKRYYKDLMLALIREHGPISRGKIDELLLDKLPEILTEKQKKTKIHNLLSELSRREGKIENRGSRKYPSWTIRDKKQ
ncbi:MAG: putative DNA binding domain-containing protein [Desulfobacterales bacterium]|nr:putative DNA binding domain-containing protein [Desulfobacterales bacterium]